jgi:glyoxylase-like metal-dependent hydrolase (beta-lactamase superfamily II)
VSTPSALPDHAIGAACVPGRPVAVHRLATRVTAPNPSMMTGPGTNTYVVGDASGVVVIDPGPPIPQHLDTVLEVIAGRRVAAVAVTHHHRDHAPAARTLADQVGAPVVGHGHPLLAVDVAAVEGTELAAGDLGLVAWHTPGHASDHLCYFAPEVGWLYTGDHVMQGSTVVVRPPDGSLTDYLASLRRVRDDRRVRRIAPGHGRVLAAPADVVEEILEHRAARGALVLEALAAHGPATAGALRPFAYPDVGPERDEVAVATCWAHLLALVEEGAATSSAPAHDPAAVFTAS